MAKSYAEHVDPAKTSPKVKWGAYVVGVLGVLATAVTAIPIETWSALGEYGLPVGMAIGGVAYGIAAWSKDDPARQQTVVTETVVSAPVAEPDQLLLTEPVVTAALHENDPIARLAAEIA